MKKISVDRWSWPQDGKKIYRCPVQLIPESDGGFSAIACTLPGAASQGDTEEEALAQITEALGEVIESYLEDGKKIPWTPLPTMNRERLYWVLVVVSADSR